MQCRVAVGDHPYVVHVPPLGTTRMALTRPPSVQNVYAHVSLLSARLNYHQGPTPSYRFDIRISLAFGNPYVE